ncbi:MarR family winged helix-turn-helix transcriptional regulator [Treponema primitia]|uniref:MarR family winged helix-turn-helix transcriptional regulator n=1 Tax=Treponema primitia TaxID=88058 RepID=UPI001E605B43|nr:MarR family transcriptional regulator [Treponema primitia]
MIHSVFRFKQLEMTFRVFHPGSGENVSMAELVVLAGIKNHTFEDGEVTIPDLLCISRAAVSQMLGVMEQKGFIIRDINKANRRKQLLSLTEKGSLVVEEQEQKAMALLSQVVDQFGERETKQFIKLSGRFMDIIEKIKPET